MKNKSTYFKIFTLISVFVFSKFYFLNIAISGGFSLCNRGDRYLKATYITQEGGLLWGNLRYTQTGFYRLPPGKCVTFDLYNYVLGYYAVFDADVLDKLNEKFVSIINRPYDEEIREAMPEDVQKSFDNALFPYKSKRGDSVCAKSIGPFEYSKPSFGDFVSDKCDKGYFRIPVVVRARGGETDGVMNLR
ncbi:hypothetical protein [uncultured Cohaesibacter sp.]|uniref:hypothetical protein n=1 Tax=uncultured Cohaesibacter sp. TaxID=1002546 RepID=UPI0029C625E2|nr:hypothetical protein [uncultured Cohaesibacter sp.]